MNKRQRDGCEGEKPVSLTSDTAFSISSDAHEVNTPVLEKLNSESPHEMTRQVPRRDVSSPLEVKKISAAISDSESSGDDHDRRPFTLGSDSDLESASSPSAASSSDSGEDGEEDGALSLEQRLLAHAKATAEAIRASRSAPPPGGGASSPSIVSDQRGADPIAAALQRLTRELTKPEESSTALTVVNAVDESDSVISRVAAAKMPKPPQAESKKLRQLVYVDHDKTSYISIRKDFYVTPPDVRDFTPEEIKELVRQLDGAKVRGQGAPRPLRSWHGAGLPEAALAVLQRHAFKAPFAVQSLATPVLMAGRDLLVTAKTGAGKTLAYVLPLLRHCADQPRCEKGEGPIGLVLVPTHELAAQVYQLLKEFSDACGLRCVASYGSTSLAENIRLAKGGCEVMVCTPGRLLDLLTVNGGKTVTLRRTSFVVVDEADRLFDSGFMEHVEAFLKNIRPDRQVAMISATMPKELKRVIARDMTAPIEISVGGKPTPASNVEQRICFFDEEVYEVDVAERREDERFVKLLQVLGDEGGDGSHLILVFTQRKEEVDELVGKLSAFGYRNRIAALYSGMDPIDREFALEHFRVGEQYILVATAVAERGLDVAHLDLVVNYTMPNHYEAYVHRIGRTGRAGRPGKAISFLTREKDDDITPELVEGLERAEQQVPEELYERAAKVRELRKDGVAHHNSSFYRGYLKSHKQRFTDRNQKEQMREAAKAAGLDGFLSASSSASDSDADSSDSEGDVVAVPAGQRGSEDGAGGRSDGSAGGALVALNSAKRGGALVLSTQQEDRIAKAVAFAQKTTDAVTAEHAEDIRFQSEYVINDLPDMVRGKLQSASFLRSVAEETGTMVVKKGVFYDPRYKHSHRLKEGERPLYLLIIGRTAESVREARHKLSDMKTDVMSRQAKKASSLGVQL